MVKPCPQRLIASLVMALLGVAIYFIPSEIPLTDPPLIGPNAFFWLAAVSPLADLPLPAQVSEISFGVHRSVDCVRFCCTSSMRLLETRFATVFSLCCARRRPVFAYAADGSKGFNR